MTCPARVPTARHQRRRRGRLDVTWAPRWVACGLVASGATAFLAGDSVAQEPAAQAPSLLEQLDRETQSLYAQTQRCVVRVQLPPPRWVSELLDGGDEHPARKWGKQLDPDVQRRLTEPQRNVDAVVLPSTQPTAPPDEPSKKPTGPEADPDSDGQWRMGTSPDGREVHFQSSVKRGDASMLVIPPQSRGQQHQAAGMRVEGRPTSSFAPNNIAIVLDDQGHLLVPIYLEREQLPKPVPVSLDQGPVASATFVGSDRQTNLTVLKCDRPIGQPAKLGTSGRPGEGVLVMILSPNNDGARLGVWTGGANEWGVVVTMDGRVSGFARHNQFLGSSLTMPVVKQIIDHGKVDRPQLGMLVMQVAPEDPVRQAGLGKRPAMRVQEVFRGSPAEAAGLQKDDLILAMKDQAIGDVPSLAAVLSAQSGQTPVTILRAGKEQTVVMDLRRDLP